ncbi:MAG: hypothetical protein U9N49_10200 [Campylobacterota bacterium]|nr:hypothetical protein [Campylobacterota bacterium]
MSIILLTQTEARYDPNKYETQRRMNKPKKVEVKPSKYAGIDFEAIQQKAFENNRKAMKKYKFTQKAYKECMKQRGYKREVMRNVECSEYAENRYETMKIKEKHNRMYQERKRNKKKINIIVTDK